MKICIALAAVMALLVSPALAETKKTPPGPLPRDVPVVKQPRPFDQPASSVPAGNPPASPGGTAVSAPAGEVNGYVVQRDAAGNLVARNQGYPIFRLTFVNIADPSWRNQIEVYAAEGFEPVRDPVTRQPIAWYYQFFVTADRLSGNGLGPGLEMDPDNYRRAVRFDPARWRYEGFEPRMLQPIRQRDGRSETHSTVPDRRGVPYEDIVRFAY